MTNDQITTPFCMAKYILDLIRNNSRSILKGLTGPQRKAVMEIIRGLYIAGRPILRHLAQRTDIGAKRQGDKYSYHLGRIDLRKRVDEFSTNRVRGEIKKNTIIAYDLTDINKEYAEKMEKRGWAWDGSRGESAKGYELHGVGVNGVLLKFEIHEGGKYTLNQIRKKHVEELSESFSRKGIWVFDRGNDDKAFFKFLRHEAKVQFIARLKDNRMLVVKETGALEKVKNLRNGKYKVYLMNTYNTDVDMGATYTLVISSHLDGKEPIRLLCHLEGEYSGDEIVNMYLERWGIENIFKRAKTKFELEKIRVYSFVKLQNLVALIQFVTNLSTLIFQQVQRLTEPLITGVLMAYRKFLLHRALYLNVDSFISFLRFSLKPVTFRPSNSPPKQLSLLKSYSLAKLVPF